MKLVLSILFLMFSIVGYTQTPAQDEAKLKALQEKKVDFHKRTEGEQDGYRIKIHFGSDRAKAMEIKSKFLAKYSEYGAYDEYQQPNFVIVVGNFKNKPEAYGFFKTIQPDFPNAFIVKDKIKANKF
ncbi:MAG: SPOR domain-containing protein [Bacteroidota bacterium]|nr:SPOR domain-containing protein [Bacteroidota bacterium]